MAGRGGRVQVEGKASLFGFEPSRVVLRIRRRATSWRATGAAARMGGFTVLAGVVAIVPPHAPWLLGALFGGAFLARRRWIERYTLESVQGACPKCGGALDVKPGRLKAPHPVTCEACHHESSITFPLGALERTEA
jgi:hypothetical protein